MINLTPEEAAALIPEDRIADVATAMWRHDNWAVMVAKFDLASATTWRLTNGKSNLRLIKGGQRGIAPEKLEAAYNFVEAVNTVIGMRKLQAEGWAEIINVIGTRAAGDEDSQNYRFPTEFYKWMAENVGKRDVDWRADFSAVGFKRADDAFAFKMRFF